MVKFQEPWELVRDILKAFVKTHTSLNARIDVQFSRVFRGHKMQTLARKGLSYFANLSI